MAELDKKAYPYFGSFAQREGYLSGLSNIPRKPSEYTIQRRRELTVLSPTKNVIQAADQDLPLARERRTWGNNMYIKVVRDQV